MKGTVKWFNNQKGYGFISDAEGHDVFVHYSGLNMEGLRHLKKVRKWNTKLQKVLRAHRLLT